MTDTPDTDSGLRREVEELRRLVQQNRADIDALLGRADAANHRANASEASSAADRLRIGDLEDRADVDRALIEELRAEGLINQAQEEHLREALRTSRRIGAAIGLVMADRGCTEEQAFEELRQASHTTNRKLRHVADELVRSGAPTPRGD